VAVIFSSGGFPVETAAVLFDSDGELTLMDEDGQLAPISFDLKTIDQEALNKFTVRPLDGKQIELGLLSGPQGECERVLCLQPNEHLRLRKYKTDLSFLLQVDDDGLDLAAAFFAPGKGWMKSGLDLKGHSLLIAEPETLARLYPGLPEPAQLPALGPRSRPSDLAERALAECSGAGAVG
jgi:hypothetical protein